MFPIFSHVVNVKDTKDFTKDQDPVHGVLKGENRKIKPGLLSQKSFLHIHSKLNTHTRALFIVHSNFSRTILSKGERCSEVNRM